MAGIDKSLVLSFDMPLYLPNPGSTAVASYISAVADLSIFFNEAENQKLAKEIIASMRSENW